MAGQIPTGAVRFEPGYTLDQAAEMPEFSHDNVFIGGVHRDTQVEALFLGRVAEYQLMRKNVWLDCEGAHAVYVIGKRRSGKTYTLGVLAEGLSAKGWIRQGNSQHAVIIFDTMNVFLTMPHSISSVHGEKSHQVEELRKWGLDPEDFKIVMFYPKGTTAPPEGDSDEIALRPCDLTGDDWAALFEVDTYADPIGHLISELYEKVAVEGYDTANQEHVAANSQYDIEDLLRCLETAASIMPPRYEQRTIEAVRRRLSAVRRLDIFTKEAINIRDVFSPGRISVLLLRDLSYPIRALLAGILIKKIMSLRGMSDKHERLASVHLSKYESLRVDDPEAARKERTTYEGHVREAAKGLPRGWVIIDEAHNYMPARGIVASSEPLKKYVNEGRNLGLSVVVATQNPSALDPSIRRNADVLIIHSLSLKDDIAAAEGMVNTFVPDSFQVGKVRVETRVFEQLLRSLPQGYAVVSNDRISRVLVVKIRPRLTVHGGVEY